MRFLDLLEERIQHFKEKRNDLKQVQGTHEQRHYVQGKLNELQYLKKTIKKNKFPKKCPHCEGNLSILSSNIDLPDKSNLPAGRTPICWPYSQSDDKSTIESFQKLTLQVKCSSCRKYFNAYYRFEDFKEVTDEASVWYDDSEHIENWRRNMLNISEDIKQHTRRSILDFLKGVFKKSTK